jgi:hypothetical protein
MDISNERGITPMETEMGDLKLLRSATLHERRTAAFQTADGGQATQNRVFRTPSSITKNKWLVFTHQHRLS